ncbi:MAG: Pr6Pr family membrane protein [Candidatus Nanopelagicales bacterium]
MIQTPFQRLLIGLNALVALAAVGVSFSLMFVGYYVDTVDLTEPTIIGNNPNGVDQVWERFFDWIGYFTILSNITVAIVMLMLVLKPEVFLLQNLKGRIWRALRLDSVLMIVITGIVYNLLLAEGDKVGWDAVSNSLQHIINPIVTLLVFLLVGPRKLLSLRTVADAMVLPIIWASVVLIRGAVISAYPYPFFDVITNGLGNVIAFILQILVFALIISALLLAYEKVVERIAR